MRPLLTLVLSASVLAVAGLSQAQEASISKLLREMKSDDPGTRSAAVMELGRRDNLPPQAIYELSTTLRDSDQEVVQESLIAVQRIGPRAFVTVPAVLRILKHEDKSLVHEALHALAEIGPAASKQAGPEIRKFVNSDDVRLKIASAVALARLNPRDTEPLQAVVPDVVAALASKDRHVQRNAVRLLSALGPMAVAELAKAVETGDPQVCWRACDALANIGPDAKNAVPGLVKLLDSSDDLTSWHAARAIGEIGHPAEGAVAGLSKALSHTSPTVRAHAASALGKLAPASKSAVEPLTKALSDDNLNVQINAAGALGALGPEAAGSAEALVTAMQEEEAALAIHAAQALSQLGPKAVPAVSKLLAEEDLRQLAAMILGQMGPAAKPAVDALIAAIDEKNETVKRDVIVALALIGPEAKPASTKLMALLEDPDAAARPAAAFALGKIGEKRAIPLLERTAKVPGNPRLQLACAHALITLDPKNEKYITLAVPRFMNGLDSELPLVRREVAEALGAIGTKAKSAVPKLTERLQKDEDESVRDQILATLAEIGPDSAEATSTIIELLKSNVPRLRYTAVFALGRIGPAAKDAMPELRKNLREDDQFLQLLSAWAMVQIGAADGDVGREAAPFLLKGVDHPNPQVRLEIVDALDKSGRTGPLVMQALRSAARDSDENVRKAAQDVLKKHDGE